MLAARPTSTRQLGRAGPDLWPESDQHAGEDGSSPQLLLETPADGLYFIQKNYVKINKEIYGPPGMCSRGLF